MAVFEVFAAGTSPNEFRYGVKLRVEKNVIHLNYPRLHHCTLDVEKLLA
jgi:hypothetical protein